jgi:GMP synthase-like glutamine amidotransferase
MRLRILAIGDDGDAPGFLGERAEELGHEVTSVSRYSDPGCLQLNGFDVLLPLGSIWSVNDATSNNWIADELDLLRKAIAEEVPVLGVCFGGQELAVLFGGAVSRARRPELGWVSIESGEPAVVGNGPWFAWHHDEIRNVGDATVIATNLSGIQAFRRGLHLGVQFHPEVTLPVIEAWCAEGESDLALASISPAQLVSESEARLGAARDAAFRLLDRFFENLEDGNAAAG